MDESINNLQKKNHYAFEKETFWKENSKAEAKMPVMI